MSMSGKGFSTLVVSVVIFCLAGSIVAAVIPSLFHVDSPRPPFAAFLVTGVVMVLLTAGLFAVVDRLEMGFGRTALTLAAGYNALIATVKLGLAPAALYEANREQSFDTTAGDPNTLLFYLVVGSVVLVLYVAVFFVMYRIFRLRFRRGAEARASAASDRSAPETVSLEPRQYGTATPQASARRPRGIVLAGLILAGVVVLVAGIGMWWVPVLLVGLPVFSYLSYLFTTFGAAILLALGLAAVLAWTTFDRVEQRASGLGDATLLASFLWFGLALILAYHVMWAVFLLALVNIWPFQTYTPK